MRLIDADAFDRALCNHEFTAALNEAADAGTAFEDKKMYYSTQSFRDVMKHRPTIDAVPVVHGKWIHPDRREEATVSGRCSNCGWEAHYYEDDVADMPYCPNCGAKMDLEEQNDG